MVTVEYAGTQYRILGNPLTGDLVLTDNGLPNGNPFPTAAQITINAGNFGSDPYTLTYQGATYIINTGDLTPSGVAMISPQIISILDLISIPELVSILEHYNELTSTLTTTDTSTVSGGITLFIKEFHYQSGIACEGC
ncbi:MAG: hypothetical protein LBV40_03455 [Methanomicrobiales archaeon]|nr:hypothetical protein [Methanomicrobiales archaeon]